MKKTQYNKGYNEGFKVGAIALTLVLILGSFLVYGVLLVRGYFDKPEFKITKEECRNETKGCENVISISFLDIKTGKIKRFPECELIEFEVCEQVEVDEIEINKEYPCSGVCDCGKTNFSCELTDWAYNNLSEKNKVDWELDGRIIKFDKSVDYADIINFVYSDICVGKSVKYDKFCLPIIKEEIIQRRNLTTEWLDGNCKYEEVCSKKYDVCSEIDENIIIGQLRQGWQISKYKCGDYFVEVK